MLFRSVLYFSNTATGVLVLTDLNKRVQANDIVTGAYSNATFTISSVDPTQTKSIILIVKPDPSTANVTDPFGYDEEIIEWPDTLV